MTVTIAPVAVPSVSPAANHDAAAAASAGASAGSGAGSSGRSGRSGAESAGAAPAKTYAQVAEHMAGVQVTSRPQAAHASAEAGSKAGESSPASQQRLSLGKDLPSLGQVPAATVASSPQQALPAVVAAVAPGQDASKSSHGGHHGVKKMASTTSSTPTPTAAPWAAPLPLPTQAMALSSGTAAGQDNPARMSVKMSAATSTATTTTIATGGHGSTTPDPAHLALLAASAAANKHGDAVPGQVTAAADGGSKLPPLPVGLPLSVQAATATATPTTAAPVLQAQVAVPPGSEHFAQALAQHLVVLAGQQVQTARLHLSPPEMGPIAVEIRLHDAGRVEVALQVSHPQTHEVLRQSADTLQGVFQNQGLQLHLQLSGGQGQGQQAPTREEWLQLTQNGGAAPVEAGTVQPLAAQIQALHRDTLLDTYA